MPQLDWKAVQNNGTASVKLGVDLTNKADLLNTPGYAARAAFQFLLDNKLFNNKKTK